MGTGRSLEPSSFEGAQLEQMRGWVDGGAGAEGVHDASEKWSEQSKYMRELAGRVEKALGDAKVSIESQSGDAMQNAMSPVVLWTEVAADSADVQSQQMQAQGDAFKTVQSSIPAKSEEQDVPDDNMFEEGFDNMFNGGTDAEKANAANEKLRQEAVQAFDSYGSTSSDNVSGSAVFTAPPEQGMNTSINGGSHVPVGQMQTPPATGGPADSGSSWAGNPSGPSGGGTLPPGSGSTGGNVGTGPTPGQTNPNYVPPNPNGPGNTGPGNPNGPGNTGPGRTGPGVPLPGTGGPGTGRGTSPGTGRGGAGGTGRGGAGGGAGGAGRGGAGGLGAGGRGGAGSPGAGGLGAGGQSGVGRGGMSGVGGGAGAAGQGAAGAGARGGAGGMGGAGARGQGANGEEDEEHYTPEFLKGDHGFFDDDMPKVAPPVFGDWDNK